MDIDEYLWRNRLTQVIFAKRVKIAVPSLCRLAKRKVTPSLVTALRIIKESKGQIDMESLLSEKDSKAMGIEVKKGR